MGRMILLRTWSKDDIFHFGSSIYIQFTMPMPDLYVLIRDDAASVIHPRFLLFWEDDYHVSFVFHHITCRNWLCIAGAKKVHILCSRM